MVINAILDGPQDIDRGDGAGFRLDQRRRDAVDDKPGRDAVHALALGLFLDHFDIFLAKALDLFAIVQLHLFNQGEAVGLRLFQTRQDGKNRGHAQGMRGDMHVLQVGLTQQFFVDADLLGHLEVVGHAHHDHAVMQGLGLFVRHELIEFRFIGVRNDALIGIDQRKAAGLNIFFLGQGEQHVEKALIGLEHLDELHHAAVGDIEFTVKAIGPRIGLGAVVADRR